MTQLNPVFFSPSKKRWVRFVTASRIVVGLGVLVMAVAVVTMLRRTNTVMPELLTQDDLAATLIRPKNGFLHESVINSVVKNFKIKDNQRRVPLQQSNRLRSAFYVNWDRASYQALRDQIESLQVVFPEWIFVNKLQVDKPTPREKQDLIRVDIDQDAIKLMRQNKVKIIPSLVNVHEGTWDKKSLSIILSNQGSRKALIDAVVHALNEHDFQGLNLDLEDLDPQDRPAFNDLVKEFSEALHRSHKMFCLSLPGMTEKTSVDRWAPAVDYLIVMAYDESYEQSAPGPVASLEWNRNLMNHWVERDYMDKIIWGLPTYGYDWALNAGKPQEQGRPVSFEEAMSLAKTFHAVPSFDPATSQVSIPYQTHGGIQHQIYLSDSASTFNAMREASDLGLRQFALWRLGAMDQRIVKFFDQELDFDHFKSHSEQLKAQLVTPMRSSTATQFLGKGDVLDVISSPSKGKVEVNVDLNTGKITHETFNTEPLPIVIQRFGAANGRDVVLTFDDGPDPLWTPQVLDILKREKVPATFFVIGVNGERNMSLVRRAYNEGHEIGNHSFTHPDLSKMSLSRIEMELNATRRLIEAVTGHTTSLFRPPFHADANPETVDELRAVSVGHRLNYYTVAESIDPRDWELGVSADQIVASTLKELDGGGGNIILLHDAGGYRGATIEALPILIKKLRERGLHFVSLAQILGKTRSDLMPELKSSYDRRFADFNWYFLSLVYFLEQLLFVIFVGAIVLSIGRTCGVTALAWSSVRKNWRFPSNALSMPLVIDTPVSVIIPAYNESVGCVATISNILQSSHKALEIVFVDDGSTDDTLAQVTEAYGHHSQVRIVSKINGGKASALNLGALRATAEILICVDADTILHKDAISHLVSSISLPEVVACAGNVKVGNQFNLLTKMQALEYITSQNLDRRAFDRLNCILVVPGAIGAFKRTAVLAVGGWSADTLAEDCELTIKLIANGGRITCNMHALAYTEAPETLKMFIKQRSRWAFGMLQTSWKYKHYLGRRGSLGWVGLPNILLFQLLMPMLAPISDLILIGSIATGMSIKVLSYFLGFLAVEVVGALIACTFEAENYWLVSFLPVQRLIYRPIMYWVILKAFASAIKGELVQWQILVRTGHVFNPKKSLRRVSPS